MINEERVLTSEEEDMIALSWWVINQHQTLPQEMVERHGQIFDFYLEACPVQVYGIMSLITNFNKGDYDE